MGKRSFQASDDFQTAMMMGMINNVRNSGTFAVSKGLASGTPVIIGTLSAAVALPPDAGEFIEIYSGDAGNDGAVITMVVLDAEFREVVVILPALAGVGAVPLLHPDTGDPFLVTRVNYALNRGPRNTGRLVAGVDIRSVSAPANVYGIVTTSQELQQAVYTVPAGCKWSATGLTVSMQKSGGADTDVSLSLFSAKPGEVFHEARDFGLQRVGTTTFDFNEGGTLNGEKGPHDLYIVCESSSAGTNVGARLNVREGDI